MLRRMFTFALFALACEASVSAVQAQHTCGLDSRNQSAVPLPVLSADTMPDELARQTREAYQTGLVEYRSRDGERKFLALRQRANADGIPCAEALAEFGLSAIYRVIRLPESRPHLLRARALFQTIGTPLTMALVDMRLAALKHMTGDNAGFLADEPAVRKELLDAGDEATEIEEETAGIEWADNGSTVDQQAALLERAQHLTSLNAMSVRGSVERNLGADLRRVGHIAEGMQHQRNVVATLTACGCNPSTLAVAYLELAQAADIGGDDRELEYALAGDRIYKQYHLDIFRPQALRIIAGVYMQRADYSRQIETLEEALALLRAQGAGFGIVSTNITLAEAYGNMGRPTKGLQIMEDTKAGKLTPKEACAVDNKLAVLADQARDYGRAVSVAATTLTKCNDLLPPLVIAELSWNTAHAYVKLGSPEEALPLAKRGIDLLDADRAKLELTDRNLVGISQRQADAYTVLIETYVALKKPEEALLAAEQGRARAFIDLTTTERRASEQRVVPGKGGAPELPIEVHRFTLTMADVRQQLEGVHATMLSYWQGDGHLFTWVVAPGHSVEVRDQPLNTLELASLVQATLPRESALTRRGGPAARTTVRTRSGRGQSTVTTTQEPWKDLYRLLIAPIADLLPQTDGALLTIVPQGPLFDLAFPALKDSSGHYLVERYAMNTVPAAGVLQITQKNDIASAALPPRYVILANPGRFPIVDGARLSALPGTLAEARGIARQLSGKPITLLEGRMAGIDNLEDELPHATVLHLATHALVSDTTPSSSFLALDSRQQGGKLTAAAVYGLHVNASLIVLSACSTGRGRITGDGVAGLSRAFFYAGAASLLTTLWDVVDEPTAKLMPGFYSGLSKGESRSTALREAQLGLIRDLRAHRVTVETLAGTRVALTESPAYWAAFSLSGQP